MKDLITILILSLFCNGWYLICHSGRIFDHVRQFYLKLAGGMERADGQISWERKGIMRWLYSPLFGCIVCIASIWGTIGYVILEWNFICYSCYPIALIKLPVIIFSVACTNLIINKLYEK